MPLTNLFNIKAKNGCKLHFSNRMPCNPIYNIYIYIPGSRVSSILTCKSEKVRSFLTKGSFGFQACVYMCLYIRTFGSSLLKIFSVMLAGRARPMDILPSFHLSASPLPNIAIIPDQSVGHIVITCDHR